MTKQIGIGSDPIAICFGLEGVGEGEFVAVGVFDVEVAFAPGGVFGFSFWFDSGSDELCVNRVGVGNVNDHSTPELDWPVMCEEIHEVRTEFEARERCISAAIDDGKPKNLAIKVHGSVHVMDSERDRIYLHAALSRHADVSSAHTVFPMEEYERITAADGAEFRAWLEANHDTAQAVWLQYYKKGSGTPSITWPEAVDQALCFGWIDSKSQTIDEERYEQYFTRRKPTSVWSKVNKDKIAALEEAGLIESAGRAAIDVAKENGSWTILDDAENHIVPDDLADAFPTREARAVFDDLSPSRRRNILQWIVLAKRADTRRRRIELTAAATNEGRAPNDF